MKPLYWWLIGAAAVIIFPLKLWVWKRMAERAQAAQQKRQSLEE